MITKKSALGILGLLVLLILGGCSSFPRTTVSTNEQDLTMSVYDTTVDYTPAALGTIYLNRTVHILDSTETKSNIKDTTALFSKLKANLEAEGYTVIDTVIDTVSDTFPSTIINVSEAVNEFTMYYYYSYWYGYYPPYYGGWYTYSYTVGTVVVGMMKSGDHLLTGTINGFTDKYTSQKDRINRGLDEIFILEPFKSLNQEITHVYKK